MKKLFSLLAVLIFLSAAVCGQMPDKTAVRAIEVTGSAEMLVTPNEFTFKITLRERLENKQKVTIDQQETRLKQELAKMGVDVQKDLTVFDLRSNYVPVRKRVRDVLGTKDYRLKVYDLAKVDQLQELADNLNIDNLDLIETTHTELTRLRRETKMEAVKAAKAKADYMLAAIGERVGKALFIQEVNENDRESSFSNSLGLAANSNRGASNSFQMDDQSSSSAGLAFTQIKLRYEVLARFEIQ
jgi:uncharacterized protein YggE